MKLELCVLFAVIINTFQYTVIDVLINFIIIYFFGVFFKAPK